MALYAIGDLHLSFSKDKPMDIFGSKWERHAEKLEKGFAGLTEDDLTVICGDISWAMSLEEAKEDFRFISRLPGKKLILKGNHDYWWSTAAKLRNFFEEDGIGNIDILHNNCFSYGEYAICGTRGWFYEEEKGIEHDAKIMRRELMRLESSLKAAGDRKKLVFLHYPPVYMRYRCEEILELLRQYEVRLCCYGHIHGRGCNAAFNGWQGGTEFKLVSADFVDFKPVRVME